MSTIKTSSPVALKQPTPFDRINVRCMENARIPVSSLKTHQAKMDGCIATTYDCQDIHHPNMGRSVRPLCFLSQELLCGVTICREARRLACVMRVVGRRYSRQRDQKRYWRPMLWLA